MPSDITNPISTGFTHGDFKASFIELNGVGDVSISNCGYFWSIFKNNFYIKYHLWTKFGNPNFGDIFFTPKFFSFFLHQLFYTNFFYTKIFLHQKLCFLTPIFNQILKFRKTIFWEKKLM